MPIEVKELPKVTRGRDKKYDFEPLFDGKPYILTQGTEEEVAAGKADFTSKRQSFRQTVYTAAAEAGHALSTRQIEHEGREAVAVQVTGPYNPKPRAKKGEGKANGKGDSSAS